MKTFLLVIVLTAGDAPNVEQHVAVFMPDRETCERLADADVYAALMTLEDDGERNQLTVEQVTCEEHIDVASA